MDNLRELDRGQGNSMPHTPYIEFYFANKLITLTKAQFMQALKDADACGCGNKNDTCLCCRVKEYWEKIRLKK